MGSSYSSDQRLDLDVGHTNAKFPFDLIYQLCLHLITFELNKTIR